jgi:hypothetical protein
VTTANLYRLNDNVTIKKIKDSNDISAISTKEHCLILKTPIGKHLENYNLQEFFQFIGKYGQDELNKKLKSFNEDIGFVCSVIAQNYCPSAIAVVQFTETNQGFKKLFEFLDEIVKPTEKTINREIERQKKIEEMSTKFEDIKKRKNSACNKG